MVGAAETPYDLRFRLLGDPGPRPSAVLARVAVLGWQDRNLPMVAVWVACVSCFDPGPRVRARLDGEGLRLLAVDRPLGHGRPVLQPGRTPDAAAAAGGGPQRARAPGSCFSLGDARHLVVLRAHAGEHLSGCSRCQSLRFSGTAGSEQVLGAIAKTRRRSSLRRPIAFSIWINLMWGLVNLLPLWPLDGGQATQILLSLLRPLARARAGATSFRSWSRVAWPSWWSPGPDDMFLTLFFAYFAVINYQVLQTLHQAHSMGLYQEDDGGGAKSGLIPSKSEPRIRLRTPGCTLLRWTIVARRVECAAGDAGGRRVNSRPGSRSPLPFAATIHNYERSWQISWRSGPRIG